MLCRAMPGVSLTGAAASHRDDLSRRGRASHVIANFDGRYLLGLIALVAAYYGAAHLGFAFQFAGPVAAIVWLPVGVGMAFLYLAGLRFWPGVVVGDLLVNNYSALPLGTALAQSVGNLLEITVAVALLRRLKSRGAPLESVPGTAGVLGAIALGCAVSATIGSLSAAIGNVIQGETLPEVWRTWWLGDFTGALIVVPLAIAWLTGPVRLWLRGRHLEGALLLAAVIGLSLIGLGNREPLSYIVFPALIWAALRFGQRGATLAIMIVSGFAIWGATHYGGPFALHSISRSVLNTQLYIAVAALSTLSLAAVVSERELLSRRLRGSRARLVLASDTERRRLERNLHDGAQQRLVALAAHLSLSATEARATPSRAEALFNSAKTELEQAIDELRNLAQGIRPPLLSRSGPASAISFAASSSQVPVELIDGPSVRLDDRAESTAYFVAMEAIANAQKHALASRIQVRFAVKPPRLHLEIADDGIGGATEQQGLGLEGLRDRVEAIGGSFEIDSEPGHGTRIAATIPCTPR
jgi:signal transduction histidine kinase